MVMRSKGLAAGCFLLLLVLAIPQVFAQGIAQKAQLPSAALKQQQERAADLFRQGDYVAALGESERLLAATRAEFGPDHEQVAIQSYGLGLVAEAARRPEIAERAFRENVRIGE